MRGLRPKAKTKTIRNLCRTDLALFAGYCFPELCRLPFSVLHGYLFKRRREKTSLPLAERQGELDVVLAPRGAAKSTLVSLIFPIHALLYRTEGYVVLISATMRQAAQRLSNLKGVLLQNEQLKIIYAEELERLGRLSARSIELGGVRIDAFSAGAELRGVSCGPWRPTWIILDDAERSDRSQVADHRDALSEWFSEVIENLGNGYTNIDVIGTLLHRDALPARLAKRPDVTARTFSSILAEARRADLWDAWRERYHNLEDPNRVRNARGFFNRNREAMLEGARVLWKEKEDYYALQVMRETRGRAAFDKEKQNAPWADGASIFAALRLRRFKLAGGRIICEPAFAGSLGGSVDNGPPELALADLRLFGFLDPALGGSGGDFAAIATVGVDPVGYLYLLDVWLERAAPSEQVRRAFDLHEQWRYQEFGIETNAFQKLLLDPFETERLRRRAQGGAWDLPILERRHRGDKQSRILTLEPLVRSGWLLFSSALSEEFMNQLKDFPGGRHDDGPDAAAAAVALARGGQPAALKTESHPRRARRATRNY